jgi:hypothetical protein
MADANAVREAGKGDVAPPWPSPHSLVFGRAKHRILGIRGNNNGRGSVEPDLRKVLDMFRNQEASRIQNQHPEVRAAVDFFSAIRTEHARTDHNDVWRDAAVIRRFIQVLQM